MASNLIRAAFATWRDRLTLAIVIPLLLALLYDRMVILPPRTALYLCGFAAFALAFLSARGVARRLDFFRTESVLAMDALSPSPARRYALAGIGAAVFAAALLIALLRPAALPIGLAGLLTGSLLGGLLNPGGLAALLPRGKTVSFAAQAWLGRPQAGAVLALVFGAALGVAAFQLARSDMVALAAIAAFLLSLPLAGVDDAAVRFMALSGFPAWRSIWHHLRGLLLFMGLATPMAYVSAGPAAAMMVAVLDAVLLLAVAMRVLAYCRYRRRFADFLVSILLAMLMVAGFSVPLVLPLVIPPMLWWLWRRARPSLWLIA